MPLEAILTVGWPQAADGEPTAQALHAKAMAQNGAYTDALLAALSELRSASPGALTIKATEQLFRRRTGAFTGLRQFAGALNEVQADQPELGNIRCEIDAFAYAFLKSAKNFDFVLPEVSDKTGPFRSLLPQWQNELKALEAFEREGQTSPTINTERYLGLRHILARPTARDERRALAALLTSGPSTREDISTDLGLAYGLGERILPTFQDTGAVERCGEQYAIVADALPCVVFCLRETLGTDLLPVL